MRIHDVMNKNVVTIAPEESVSAARERIRAEGIHHLVVTERKKIVGVLSDRDLTTGDDEARVKDVMTKETLTITPGETLRKAAGMLDGANVSCLPVVEDGKLAGIVTTSDLLRALAKGATHPEPPSERYILRKRGPRKRGAPI